MRGKSNPGYRASKSSFKVRIGARKFVCKVPCFQPVGERRTESPPTSEVTSTTKAFKEGSGSISQVRQEYDLSQAQNREAQPELSITRPTLARNNERKSQTRTPINSRNKCDLRVLTVVTRESIIKLNDWLLGLQSSAMILLALGTDTSRAVGPKG